MHKRPCHHFKVSITSCLWVSQRDDNQQARNMISLQRKAHPIYPTIQKTYTLHATTAFYNTSLHKEWKVRRPVKLTENT
jgi:hypothetical protein